VLAICRHSWYILPAIEKGAKNVRIVVSVRIEQEPSEQPGTAFGGYGTIGFNEEATLTSAGFETVSAVFTRVHELLDTLRKEHKQRRP
jgi:hypothetical protein